MNREQWLHHVTEIFRPRFAKIDGLHLPKKLQISIGFPSKLALSAKKQRVGECWIVPGHIFVSPVVASAHEAGSILIHELVHAALPAGVGHKAAFVHAGAKLGLTDGKPTCLGAGPELLAELKAIAKRTPFKHRALAATALPKPQGSRLLKVSCPECEYTVRVTRSWLDTGSPICPLDNVSMEEG